MQVHLLFRDVAEDSYSTEVQLVGVFTDKSFAEAIFRKNTDEIISVDTDEVVCEDVAFYSE